MTPSIASPLALRSPLRAKPRIVVATRLLGFGLRLVLAVGAMHVVAPVIAHAACCYEGGVCEEHDRERCEFKGGVFQGDSTACDPNPCPQPARLGACCAEDGSCALAEATECAGESIWLGEGSLCDLNPCSSLTGACCAPDGVCAVVTRLECRARGGVRWAIGRVCTDITCDRPILHVALDPSGDAFEWVVVASDAIVSLRGQQRIAGSRAYLPIAAFFDGPGAWTAELGVADPAIRGIEYYLVCTTGDGTEVRFGTPDAPKRIASAGAVAAPRIEPSALRMISAPLLAADRHDAWTRLSALFGPSGPHSWEMSRWDPTLSTYSAVDATRRTAFDFGAAYWIGFAQPPPEWKLEGISNLPPEDRGAFEIALPPGWSMVGSPTAYTATLDPLSVEIRDGAEEMSYSTAAEFGLVGAICLYAPAALDPSEPLYPYDVNPRQLAPWDGCWIRNLTDRSLTLLIPAEEAEPAERAASPDPTWSGGMWTGSLSFRSAGERVGVEFTVDPSAQLDLDWLDVLHPPLAPDRSLRAVLSASDAGVVHDIYPSARLESLLRDVRPSIGGVVTWPLEINAPKGPVEISASIPVAESGDSGDAPRPRATLHEASTGRVWSLDELASLTLPAGEHHLEIRFDEAPTGPAASIASALVVEPNPFSTDVYVRFQLESEQRCSIDVFDATGARVWSRRDDRRAAGQHVVLWNGLDRDGSPVPTGAYFVRVESVGAGGARVTRSKVVKLR